MVSKVECGQLNLSSGRQRRMLLKIVVSQLEIVIVSGGVWSFFSWFWLIFTSEHNICM